MSVTGCNFVRFSRHGLQAIRKHWASVPDRFEIRRQALKLRWWDERQTHGAGLLFDLTYESIKALSGSGIYELRIDDVVGDHDNIRIVLFDPPSDWIPLEEKPLKIVWVLEALQKERDGWTKNELNRFSASRLLLKQRCYR